MTVETLTQQNEPERVAVDHSEDKIVLCPGQGAQHVGMGQAWFEHSSAAREIFEAADQELGFELSRLCFEGPVEQLNRTEIAQAAIYTTSVACFAGLNHQGQIGTISATAGLSLGEFTALHLAGVFDFLTGLRLVRRRGQAMQEAADNSAGGMVALVGASVEDAQRLCQQTLDEGESEKESWVLVPANYNCPGQIVISGSQKACDSSLKVAQQLELNATPLKVAGAFHSPLMKPAAHQLAMALEEVEWLPPTVPVVSNVNALPHSAAEGSSIKTRLVEQLTHPVKWTDSMQWLVSHVQGRYVELAPGKVLTGLMRRIDREQRVLNCAKVPSK